MSKKTIEVTPANHGRAFREFLYFPFRIYQNNSRWVPPLLRDVKAQFSPENPFFRHAEVMPFIARVNGKTVGRITATYNEAHVNFSKEEAGFFGFFDCIDDPDVAMELIERVKVWLRERGLHLMRGPANFSSNEEWGLLVDGYDEAPMLMMPYNHPYYQGLLEGCGLVKAKDLFAYILEIPEAPPEKVLRIGRLAERQGVRVRPMNIDSFKKEMSIFKEVYNSAWERNWGFIPMTEDEIEYMARRLKPLIIPELTLIAECEGEPVGFMMLLPDFNYVLKRLNGRLFPFGIFKIPLYARQIRDVRLLLLGIKEGFRRRGVDALLLIEGLKGVKRKGYRRVEFSWVLEDNYPVRRLIENASARLYKRYRIYETNL